MKNILLITSDELRYDSLGCTGNPDVKSPHIDALAKSGAQFDNHFVPFPKCVPSRCAMQTGRYTHTDGIRSVMRDNHLEKGTPTLLECLSSHGYETTVLGLNHVWEDDWFYGPEGQRGEKGAGVSDYTSFTKEYTQPLAMTGCTYPDGEARTGAHIEALADVDFDGLATGKVERHFSDENRTNQAIHYLENIRDPQKPFYLQLNLSRPHPAYKIHEPYYSMYAPDAIEAFPSDLPEGASLPLRAMREHRLGNDIPEASLREIQAVYYGMITCSDQLVGQVIETLEKQGLREDTLIIFCSDHGDFAGQHGINEKWDAALQDCLLKVPFIMSGPGIPENQRISHLTEHVDLPATILEYLDLDKGRQDWNWHGTSMLPCLEGQETKKAVFADGGHESAMRDRAPREIDPWQEKDGKRIKKTGGKQLTYVECPDSMARAKMIRTQEWKLVIREVGGNELFHVAEDPYEMTNLYGNPEYKELTAELMYELIQWTLRTDTDRPYLQKIGA
ncbi:MAG: sulfatase-like hydrolase/transferase [Opitutales bacterium]|nr:sulfatase-like hydrolase/transferase [Opitutales bacterium]NRA26729.1 sulfatase-like hydrolase/transferase [Opitutales bacterium]